MGPGRSGFVQQPPWDEGTGAKHGIFAVYDSSFGKLYSPLRNACIDVRFRTNDILLSRCLLRRKQPRGQCTRAPERLPDDPGRFSRVRRYRVWKYLFRRRTNQPFVDIISSRATYGTKWKTIRVFGVKRYGRQRGIRRVYLSRAPPERIRRGTSLFLNGAKTENSKRSCGNRVCTHRGMGSLSAGMGSCSFEIITVWGRPLPVSAGRRRTNDRTRSRNAKPTLSFAIGIIIRLTVSSAPLFVPGDRASTGVRPSREKTEIRWSARRVAEFRGSWMGTKT